MNNIFVNVEGAIFRGDKWLMIVRGKTESHAAGTLSMVGGKLESDIDLDDALELTLFREIEEEVGIEVGQHMDYVESKVFTSETGQKVLDVVFLCEFVEGIPQALTSEVSEVLWLTTEEVLKHPKAEPWTRQSIRLAAKKLQSLSQ